MRPTETTAKVIASEVAVGENTYYGSIRPIGDDYDKNSVAGTLRPASVVDAGTFTRQGHAMSVATTAAMFDDWRNAIGAGVGDGGVVANSSMEVVTYDDDANNRLEYGGTATATATAEEAKSPPLSLQLFISSLSDALSYTSADTTATEFRYNGPQGSSVLNVTPMGSTTKLIASETSSNFKVCAILLFFSVF